DDAAKTLAEALGSDPFEVAAAGEEGVDDLGVPLGAGTFAEDRVDGLGAQPATVGAAARHGVESIGDGEDPGGQGDRLAGEPGRVAAAVKVLVVVRHAWQ